MVKHRCFKTTVGLVFLLVFPWVNSAALAGQNSSVAFTVNQLVRQFTLRSTVGQVNQGLQGFVVEANGKLRGPAMAATAANFPGDMGTVPGGLGVPNRDGAGRLLGFCAWDNNAATDGNGYLAGASVTVPMVYAVLSSGINGSIETTCADIANTRTASGDDYLEIRYPQNTASQQFKTAVNTVANLNSIPANDGDVRLVFEDNRLYSYNAGVWTPVAAGGTGVFNDDSGNNGANAISHTAGLVTVAEFVATTATLSSNLSVAGTSVFTGPVTASNGITVGSGGINVTGASSITGNTTVVGALAVSNGATITGTLTATTFSGSGESLTNLNASNVSDGLLSPLYGGTGVNSSAASNGALLIGNGSGFTLGSLMGTANQVIVNNTAGNLQIALPQNIAANSTPTFAGVTLSNELSGTTALFSGKVAVTEKLGLGDISGALVNTNGFGIKFLDHGPVHWSMGMLPGSTTFAISNTTSSSLSLFPTIRNDYLQINASTGAVTFSGAVTASAFSGDGSGLTNLSVSNFSSGVLPVARGGTGLGTVPSNGQLLIGNGTGYTLANLGGTPNQINVSNSAGAITLSLPQNIASTSTPTFGGLTLNGAISGTTASFTGVVAAQRLNLADTSGVSIANLVIGTGAMAATPTGTGANVAIGSSALAANTSGHFNTAVGYQSLMDNTTGERNVAMGYQALANNTNGNSNIAIGEGAMVQNTIGSDNIAIGQGAMYGNGSNGSGNIALGKDALFDNNAQDNVAVGISSMRNNTTGNNQVAVGRDSLLNSTTGMHNVALGRSVLQNNSTGSYNTAVGTYALRASTTAEFNSVLGESALRGNTTGSANVALGINAGYATAGGVTTNANFTGSNNTFVGSYAMPGSTSQLSYATALGAEALVDTSNTVVLGRATDKTVIGATGDDGSANILQVTGSVKAIAFNTSSDRRLKTNINMLGDDLLAGLSKLSVYNYRFIADPNGVMRYGVIAQEIAPLFPYAVSYDNKGVMAVDYGALGAIAAAGVGKLNTRLIALTDQVDKQGEKLTALEKDLLGIDDRVKTLEAWKLDTGKRLDGMQNAINLNIEQIAEHALKIASNTEKITSLDQVTQEQGKRLLAAESGLESLKQQWGTSFAKSEDGSTLTVLVPNLVASNFSAENIRTRLAYAQRLEAEMARIALLEVEELRAKRAHAGSIRADEMNTGSAEIYVPNQMPVVLFSAPDDGHYSVSVRSRDGSYAIAAVIVNDGVARVIPSSNEGIDIQAEGRNIKGLTNGKLVKVIWTKHG